MGTVQKMEHVDGVPWHEAKIPFWIHRCRPQTFGVVDARCVERCACGAIRLDGYGPWVNKNSRRRSW